MPEWNYLYLYWFICISLGLIVSRSLIGLTDIGACTEVRILLISQQHFHFKCMNSINISFAAGSAVNIILVTPEKAIKLTANDIFRYTFLDKHG